MISGKLNVEEWFKMQARPFFSIFRKGKEESGNYVYSNKDAENVDMDTAVPYLSNCLSLISAGDFFIYANKTKDVSSKGRAETFFSISLNQATAPAAAQISGTGSSNLSYEEIENRAEAKAVARFEQLMDKRELADTRRKLTEIEKELREARAKVDGPVTKFMEAAAPYFPNIISGFFPATPAIGNIPDTNNHVEDNTPVVELTEEQQQQMGAVVQSFCESLAARYPVKDNADTGYLNWLQVLEKLQAVLHNDPTKIDMALKFL